MKIGDMVKHNFIPGVERYGIIIEDDLDRHIGTLAIKKKYFKVRYLPHADIPFNGGDMYSEYTCEEYLTVVSSV